MRVFRSTLVPGALALAALSTFSLACGDAEDDEPLGEETQEFATGPKLAFDEYSVLFTNPACQKYSYAQPVASNSGAMLSEKPENAYCKQGDAAGSAARDSSPQKKLLGWIADPSVTEIFFAYLSFSNRVVGAELCKAITERNVKVTFVLDRETDLSAANQLLACHPGNGDPALEPRMELRGHDATIGYAHNKIFMFNPRSEAPRIVFSSGNLSSGVVLHHENWHFLRVPGSTHFAKAHVCLMDGVLDHYRNKAEYGSYILGCRNAAGVGEESDLKTFFVPGDGGRAGKAITNGIRAATAIDIAAHRFSYRLFRTELTRALTRPDPPTVRLVMDDDVYWANKDVPNLPNTKDEFALVSDLAAKGLDVRFMQTNHAAHYLHHNKFVVFDTPQGGAVFTGAGNFTGTAFADNFENFYYVTIPHVVEAMKAQHDHLFELATPEADLPAENVLP